jgi:hypothetical protein
MKKIIFTIITATLGIVGVYAQQAGANISFSVKEHDFGTIKEADGPVTCKFEFVNTGSEPLTIQKVQPSCGCTTPDYTKSPVLPGQKGFVSATFNPSGRPGVFSKNITVMSNSNPANTVLVIKGEVIGKTKSESAYNDTLGGILFAQNHLSFGKLKNTEKKTLSVNVMNPTAQPVKITFQNTPKHLTIKVEPEVLFPKTTGKIEITYNASLKNDWGYLLDQLNIAFNGKANAKEKLAVSADIIEDFSKLTNQQRIDAPKASVDTSTYNYGTVKEGTKVEHVFTLVNSGKSDLIIRKVISSCGCTTVKPQSNIIKPGGSTTLKVVFDTKGRSGEGDSNKMVTLVLNDPSNSKIMLWLKGKIIK